MTATEVFAKRLKELREKNEMTQSNAAEKLGITAQSLSLYEKGLRTINIDLLKKVAELFDVSSDYLIGISNTATTDTDMKAVCEFTGLTEQTVKTIRNIFFNLQLPDTEKQYPKITKKYYWQCINYFISLYLEEFLTEIIDGEIEQYYLDAYVLKIDKEMSDELDGVIPLTGTKADELEESKDRADFCRYKVERECKKIISNYLECINFGYRLINSNLQLKEVSDNGNNNPKNE